MPAERLRITRGAGAGGEISVDNDFVVGRGETGMGNLGGDPEISRRHARFRRLGDGQILLEDLGSTNGTFVNGQLIQGPHVLTPGDRITLGKTELQLDGATPATHGGTPVAVIPAAAVGDQGRAQAAPPAPGAGAPAFETGLLGRSGPGTVSPRSRRLRAVLLGVVALIVVGGAAAAIIAATSGSTKTAAGATVAADCGANIGKAGRPAFVAYVESNVAQSGRNSVIAIPFRSGDLKPLAMSQCAAGGSGSTDLTDSGVLDANDQIAIDPKHTLLFAVNQGSDTIAVFHIQPNGGLKPVAGSPFPSGGKAPSSLGLSGKTLVVSNKAMDGVRDLKAAAPNYTTFTVGSDGRLTPVAGSTIQAKPLASPTDASVAPRGGVVFGTEESGPIRSFTVSPSGVLKEAPGSPYNPPAQLFAPGYDPAKLFALGVAPHPTKPLVYIGMPTVPALAVYSFDNAGRLKFQGSAPVGGAYLPCWIQITKDGRWLYTSNADTNNLTAFDIGNPTRPKQIQTLPYQTPGNPWNIALDPSSKFLFGIAPRDTLKVPEGEGNTLHVMRVGADGKLSELNATAPLKIPVPKGTNPQGIAVIAPGA